ncbi:MAG TPA: AtpZ/AtpI family protein [Candidatus Kapabacteria bacterium]|jgi:F0F1-type ATP synthase assembly protein I|nr:AtpZ/AtpI family protein [Candidatus Kapabacteria bacterium]
MTENETDHKATEPTHPTLSSRLNANAAEQNKAMRDVGPYLTLGIQMAASVLIFFGIGYWLDRVFHTSSMWTIILTIFGAISGLAYFLVTVVHLSKKEETKRP